MTNPSQAHDPCLRNVGCIFTRNHSGYCSTFSPSPVPAPRPSETPLTEDELSVKVTRAYAEIHALCHGKRWLMSIPVRPEADSDTIICDALRALKDRVKILEAELARRSPSVPTATQEQRATDYRDFETFGDLPESVRVAVRAHTFAQPAGGELWDNMTSREQRNWMVQLYDKANRGPSSEEAANGDTERLNWLDKWAVRIGLGDSGVHSFVWVDADGNESELPEADLYEKYENIRKAIDAARVQGEN